jgi:hypothetical protein
MSATEGRDGLAGALTVTLMAAGVLVVQVIKTGSTCSVSPGSTVGLEPRDTFRPVVPTVEQLLPVPSVDSDAEAKY